jgi:hypothetical protein
VPPEPDCTEESLWLACVVVELEDGVEVAFVAVAVGVDVAVDVAPVPVLDELLVVLAALASEIVLYMAAEPSPTTPRVPAATTVVTAAAILLPVPWVVMVASSYLESCFVPDVNRARVSYELAMRNPAESFASGAFGGRACRDPGAGSGYCAGSPHRDEKCAHFRHPRVVHRAPERETGMRDLRGLGRLDHCGRT